MTVCYSAVIAGKWPAYYGIIAARGRPYSKENAVIPVSELSLKAALGLVALAGVIAVALFGGAGTLRYWQAWLFLACFIGPAAWLTLYLWKYDRALLERRVGYGPADEKERTQRLIQSLASIAFIGYLLVPALDRRLGWSAVPIAAVIAGDALILTGFFVVFAVFRENSFSGATIAVAKDQRVISTGPYAIVRHPMYSGAILLFVGIPLALASWFGFLMLVPMTSIVIWRLLAEERFLLENLPAYANYRQHVRYRLIPLMF